MRVSRCLRYNSLPSSTRPHFDPYNALTQVFEIPKDKSSSAPLAGLSYVVKENICTKQGATTCCSPILGAGSDTAYRSPFTATCVELLESSGARLAGKTNMDEFGMGSFTSYTPYGPTLNPHDLKRTAGGSSGGSAAALLVDKIQDGSLDFALGTDTGGSVRIPASYCGIHGFKPSYGRISRLGIVPYANSLDTVGILSARRSGIQIIRRVFNVLDKKDENDPTSLSHKSRSLIRAAPENRTGTRLRIGVPAEYNLEELSAAVSSAWKEALHLLLETGCELVPVSLPSTQAALAAYYVLAPSEASSNLQKYSGVFYGARAETDRLEGRLYAATRDLFGDEVKRRILLGCLSLSSDKYDNYYLQAQRIRRKLVEEFNGVFLKEHPIIPWSRINGEQGVDYLLVPTVPTVAPLLSEIVQMSPAESYAADVLTVPASMAGLPSISIPFGSDDKGMPIGMQLMGQYGDDLGVLDVAEMLKG